MSELKGYAAAQARYDNMSPPEGAGECSECGGKGRLPAADPDEDPITCPVCEGSGLVDENGRAFDPEQAQRGADDAAEERRGSMYDKF